MQYTNSYNISLPLAVWLCEDNYAHSNDPHLISATSLLKSTRQIILNTRIPPTLDVSDISTLFASRLGSAIHDSIEDSWKDPSASLKKLNYPQKVIDNILVNPTPQELLDKPDATTIYLEKRINKQVGKWTISGQYDMVCDGEVQDYKSTSVYSYTLDTNGDKHTKQMSIYRWLNPDVITKSTGKIHYLLKDWSKGKSFGGDYPPLPTMTKSFNLMSPAETESFILNKLKEIETNFHLDEADIPRCTDEELWRRAPVWKYYAKADSKRASKNFDNSYAASTHLASKGKGHIKEVKGTPTACTYCASAPICSQAQGFIAAGELKL